MIKRKIRRIKKYIPYLFNYISKIKREKRIILTGANGFIGSRIFGLFSKKYFVVPFNREKIDIKNKNEINELFEKVKPDYVIHSAALSNPEYCEKNKEKAYEANVVFTENLLEATKKQNAKFVFFSSALVFKPVKNLELERTEEEEPDAECYYGQTKIKAENEIKKYSEHLIIRIGWQYSELNDVYANTNSMLHYVFNQIKNNQEIEINKNEYGNPTYVYDTLEFLLKNIETKTGIYHYANPTEMPLYKFFEYIIQKYSLKRELLKIKDLEIRNNRIKSEKIKINKDGIERLKEILK
ncbi:MAG TPA: sugar nucleotide-binding protein [bacterium]|nr:sugar nucleotide-binding protein [bacterium]HOL47065.1 sugar nucleotide-binding protein [bacterium]HPQ18965.1 sugar nucleotide-binding protein [bacterium]